MEINVNSLLCNINDLNATFSKWMSYTEYIFYQLMTNYDTRFFSQKTCTDDLRNQYKGKNDKLP